MALLLGAFFWMRSSIRPQSGMPGLTGSPGPVGVDATPSSASAAPGGHERVSSDPDGRASAEGDAARASGSSNPAGTFVEVVHLDGTVESIRSSGIVAGPEGGFFAAERPRRKTSDEVIAVTDAGGPTRVRIEGSSAPGPFFAIDPVNPAAVRRVLGVGTPVRATARCARTGDELPAEWRIQDTGTGSSGNWGPDVHPVCWGTHSDRFSSVLVREASAPSIVLWCGAEGYAWRQVDREALRSAPEVEVELEPSGPLLLGYALSGTVARPSFEVFEAERGVPLSGTIVRRARIEGLRPGPDHRGLQGVIRITGLPAREYLICLEGGGMTLACQGIVLSESGGDLHFDVSTSQDPSRLRARIELTFRADGLQRLLNRIGDRSLAIRPAGVEAALNGAAPLRLIPLARGAVHGGDQLHFMLEEGLPRGTYGVSLLGIGRIGTFEHRGEELGEWRFEVPRIDAVRVWIEDGAGPIRPATREDGLTLRLTQSSGQPTQLLTAEDDGHLIAFSMEGHVEAMGAPGVHGSVFVQAGAADLHVTQRELIPCPVVVDPAAEWPGFCPGAIRRFRLLQEGQPIREFAVRMGETDVRGCADDLTLLVPSDGSYVLTLEASDGSDWKGRVTVQEGVPLEGELVLDRE